jgi:hypothetical protein
MTLAVCTKLALLHNMLQAIAHVRLYIREQRSYCIDCGERGKCINFPAAFQRKTIRAMLVVYIELFNAKFLRNGTRYSTSSSKHSGSVIAFEVKNCVASFK